MDTKRNDKAKDIRLKIQALVRLYQPIHAFDLWKKFNETYGKALKMRGFYYNVEVAKKEGLIEVDRIQNEGSKPPKILLKAKEGKENV